MELLRRIASFRNVSNSTNCLPSVCLAKAGFFIDDDKSMKTYCCNRTLKRSDDNDVLHSLDNSCRLYNEHRDALNKTSFESMNLIVFPKEKNSTVEIPVHKETAKEESSSIDVDFKRKITLNRQAPTKEFLDYMKDANLRLTTYYDFPTSCRVSTESLVEAGFFYTGKEDRVKCAFCYGALYSWEEDDVALIEHIKYYATCPFVKGISCGNIPLKQTPELVTSELNTASEEEVTLETENMQLKENMLCKICMEVDFNTVLLPCSHLICCDNCAKRINFCPICRSKIKATVLAFMS